MSNGNGNIVELEALNYAIGGRQLLNGLSLSVPVGEHLLILGPSGTGKTSLINLVTGLATPSSGYVRISGEPMSELSGPQRDELRRRNIGVVFQSLRLVSALSVRGNLKLAQKLSGQAADDAPVNHLIDAVGITHRADAKPRQLSQGEAQRAAIARALVGKPKLLVADEPTSALDDSNAEKIAHLLLDTASEYGSTLVIATHDARLKAFMPKTYMLANGSGEAA